MSWSVLDLSRQYGTSKQMIFNYIKEMKDNNIKGYTFTNNQYDINEVGYNYILERRQKVTQRVEQVAKVEQPKVSNILIDYEVLKVKNEHLLEKVQMQDDLINQLRDTLRAKETELQQSQNNYIELTNKTIGLLLPEGKQEEPQNHTETTEKKSIFWRWKK